MFSLADWMDGWLAGWLIHGTVRTPFFFILFIERTKMFSIQGLIDTKKPHRFTVQQYMVVLTVLTLK